MKNTPFLIHDPQAINTHCNVRLASGGISTVYKNTLRCQYAACYVSSVTHCQYAACYVSSVTHCQYAACYVSSVTHCQIPIRKFIYIACILHSATHYMKVKVKLTLEQAMLAQMGSRGLFVLDRGGLSPPSPGRFTLGKDSVLIV